MDMPNRCEMKVNPTSIFSTLGASNHSDYERVENDFYATHPTAIDKLFEKEVFYEKILEPCAGNGHLSERMKQLGKSVVSWDLVQREYPLHWVGDFLSVPETFNESCMDIITNPPYKYALEFVKKSIAIHQMTARSGAKIAMFLKLTFLEGQKRQRFFLENPPARIYVFSKRMPCARNGKESEFQKSSAACYAWFVWEKGVTQKPIIDWI